MKNIRNDVAENATNQHFEAQVAYICTAFQDAKPLSPMEAANVKRREALGSYEPIVYKQENVAIPSGRTADITVIRGFFIEEVVLEALLRLRSQDAIPPYASAVEIMKSSSGMVKEIRFINNLK